MKSVLTALALVSLLSGSAFAQSAAPAATCDTQAMTKKLAGAAKNSFVKKCKTDACAAKAIDKNGKPLAGAAKASFMKKCEQEA
jgi:hypothetical protein